MTSIPGASYWEQRTIAYNELQRAIARLAALAPDYSLTDPSDMGPFNDEQ